MVGIIPHKTMKNVIVRKDIDRLIRSAKAAANIDGKEICGLLIHNGHFIEVIQTKNKLKRSGSYIFDAREIKQIENATHKLKHEIIGTFHSHPAADATPGARDISFAVEAFRGTPYADFPFGPPDCSN